MDNLQLVIKKKNPQYIQDNLSLDNNSNYKMPNTVSAVEKVLISKLKIGDSSAFTSIFIAYYKDLVIFASRFTKEFNTAEEIVQDTFVKLWEEHESVNINISLKSYLLKTVQNKCLDWFRHNKIMKKHDKYVMESSLQFEFDTDSYILHSELQEEIEATLCKLPDEIAETFRMNRYKGLRYAEIAEILNVSVRTIEVRIGKALNMLRNHLKDYLIIIIGFFTLFFQNIH
jgi:RNA polymerase sigma-70 factor, ECF subfamily